MSHRAALALAALCLLGAGPSHATAPESGSDATGVALPAPGSEPWEPLFFRRIERHTSYTALQGGDVAGVRAESECAASALVLPLEDVDWDRTPRLAWRWRLLRPLSVSDERSRGGDDFAARVYVMFRFDPEGASLLARARQRLGEALFDAEMPGTALSFVWTSRVAPGEIWTNPWAQESKMVAIARGTGGGPAEVWRPASVDVPATYERAFGRTPPPSLALGIMTDADDTCQHAVAEYADFRLVGAAS